MASKGRLVPADDQGQPGVSAVEATGQGPTGAPSSFLHPPPQHRDDTSPTTGTSPPGRALGSSFLAVGPDGAASRATRTLARTFPSWWGSLVSPQVPFSSLKNLALLVLVMWGSTPASLLLTNLLGQM